MELLSAWLLALSGTYIHSRTHYEAEDLSGDNNCQLPHGKAE
jgi:hypothetical protein